MNENGALKLYYAPVSFYSQRALFTLYEKRIKFEHVLIDIHAGGTYTESYLHLNPHATVPTLQDGVKVIPDSSEIKEYLEDNFSNGKHPRLRPLDKSSEEYIKIAKFTEECLALNIPVFTYGTLLNESMRPHIQIPSVILNRVLKNKDHMSDNIDRAIDTVPETREVLLKKRETMKAFMAGMEDPSQYAAAIRGVETYLQLVEHELATHTGGKVNWWLCGPNFSLADIDLCVLLGRIAMLGFEERLITSSQPHLSTYLRRARLRPSYQNTCIPPLKMRLLLLAERVVSFLPKLVLGMGFVAAIAYGVYAARR